MTISRSDILTMSRFLAFFSLNNSTLATFLDDCFNELGLSPTPRMIKPEIKSLTSGLSYYDFESDMLQIIAAFYNGQQVHFSSVKDLESYAKSWRYSTGSPLAITQDSQSARKYVVYPFPSVTSYPLIPIHGEPYGEDFPANSLTLIYADNRQSGINETYLLPLAFDTLAKEFSYPSDHTDTVFADGCKMAAKLLYGLAGIKYA